MPTMQVVESGSISHTVARPRGELSISSRCDFALEDQLEISRVITYSLEPGELYPALGTAMRRLIPFDQGMLLLVDVQRRELAIHGHLDGDAFEDPECGTILRAPPFVHEWRLGEGGAELVPDVARQDQSEPLWQILTRRGLGTVIHVPLYHRGELRGVLGLATRAPGGLDEEHRELADQVADLIVPAIVNAVQHGELRASEQRLQAANASMERRVRSYSYELQVLHELSRQLGTALDYEQLFRLMMEHLHQVMDYDVAAGILVTGDHVECFVRPSRPMAPEVLQQVYGQLQQTLDQLTDCLRTHRDVEVASLVSPACSPGAPAVEALDSIFQVPLFSGVDKEIVGLLLVGAERREAFTEEHVRLLYTVANQANSAIQRLRSLLAGEQQRIENLVKQLPEGVILLDESFRPLLINPSAERYLALLGNAGRGASLETVGDRSVQELIRPPGNGLPHEVRSRGDMERIFEATADASTVGPSSGGWVLVLREVTGERQIQREMAQQGRLAAVGQLAAGIAHDFNNLLTAILGFAHLLQQNPSVPPEAGEDVKVIILQARRAATLVSQILDFSRQSVTQKAAMDLVPFLKETHELLRRTIPETIQISLDLAPGEHWVEADVTQLQRVLTNLAINARDAMPEGGTLRLQLSHRDRTLGALRPLHKMQDGPWVMVEISDAGCGIPEAIRDRVFEPFFTTKGVGKGTGLGLAQAYGIITQHDGHITIDSREGKGTTVSIWLPQTNQRAAHHSNAAEPASIGGQGETILLVEDEPQVLRAIQRQMKGQGYRVLTANNGIDALALYDEDPQAVDLVLTDVTMPEMGGFALMKKLREREAALPIILMSGYPMCELDMQQVDNATAWIEKPPDRKALLASIRLALG